MDQEIFFLICVSPLILNIGLGIYLVVNLSRYRLSPTARSLIAMVFGGALWSFGYSMEIISADLPAKLFWAKFQYFGIATIPLAWFSFAYQYVGLDGRSQMPVSQRLAISFLPAVTIVLVWTNELHGLIWRGVQLQPVGSFKVLQLDHGPGFWVYWAYSYCLLFVGSFRLVVGLISSFQTNRRRNVIRLAAILIPWFANLVYVSELNPIPHLDWSPFSFTVAGLLFSISLYHFSLIDILPIAEKKVFEVLPDCLLVLDAYGNLVDMNAAAKKMVPDASLDWRGKPLADIVPELYQWVSQADFTREYRFETTRAAASGKVFHDLRIVPLTSFDHRPVGHLVACHDITPYRRVQAQLEQIRDQLEVTVAQRTAELRSTVDQLQFELVERTLAEKRFQDVVESAPDAMLLVDQDGKIRLVNAQAEALFGCSRESLLGQNIEAMIAEDTRHLHSE